MDKSIGFGISNLVGTGECWTCVCVGCGGVIGQWMGGWARVCNGGVMSL